MANLTSASANNSGIKIFDVRAPSQRIYQQYRAQQWLRDYAVLIDNFIQENYFSILESMWDEIDVADSEADYLTFYTKWYFGLFRPLGGSSIAEFYDAGIRYDMDKKYDDASKANGLITAEQYLKYIKFIYDYSQETWTIDYIIRFVADYCGISPTDIELDYSNKNEIVVILPQLDKCGDFIKLEISYREAMCMPFSNIVTFNLKQDDGIPDSADNIAQMRTYCEQLIDKYLGLFQTYLNSSGQAYSFNAFVDYVNNFISDYETYLNTNSLTDDFANLKSYILQNEDLNKEYNDFVANSGISGETLNNVENWLSENYSLSSIKNYLQAAPMLYNQYLSQNNKSDSIDTLEAFGDSLIDSWLNSLQNGNN